MHDDDRTPTSLIGQTRSSLYEGTYFTPRSSLLPTVTQSLYSNHLPMVLHTHYCLLSLYAQVYRRLENGLKPGPCDLIYAVLSLELNLAEIGRRCRLCQQAVHGSARLQ